MNIANRQDLITAYQQGKRPKYLYFWGHTSKSEAVGKQCFSQWYKSSFSENGNHYHTAEHYMMEKKARLFDSDDIAEEILNSSDPGKVKALGRQVKGFDESVWNNHRFEIVVQGNLLKFSQNESLKQFLLSTKERVLVEASPVDKIWGIGLAEDDEKVQNPLRWKGDNLLGFALMKVRTLIKEGSNQ